MTCRKETFVASRSTARSSAKRKKSHLKCGSTLIQESDDGLGRSGKKLARPTSGEIAILTGMTGSIFDFTQTWFRRIQIERISSAKLE